MPEFVTGVTFGGTEWTPSYVTDINQKTCIGCGRCFKVCPRDVFDLVEKAEALDPEDLMMIMAILKTMMTIAWS